MATVDVTNQPVVVEATNDVAVVSFTENSAVVEVPNPQPVVEFTAGGTLTAGTGLVGGGYLTGNITLGLSPASVASLAKAETAVQPGANLSSFVNDLNLATNSVLSDAIAALSSVYQPLNVNLTAIAGLFTTAFGRSLLESADAAASRSLIGVYSTSEVLSLLSAKANSSHTHSTADITGGISWSNLTGIPLTFPPGAHNHVKADVTDFAHTHVMADLTDYVAAGAWGSISGTLSAQTDLQSALDGKAAASHTHPYYGTAGGDLTGNISFIGTTIGISWWTGSTPRYAILQDYNSSTKAELAYYNTGTSNWISNLRWGATGTEFIGAVSFDTTPTVGGTAVSVTGHTHSYLPLTGGTLTGALTAAISLIADGAAGNHRGVRLHTSGSLRWLLSASNEAEGGSNSGSNLTLYRYSDAAGYLGQVLRINRATGEINVIDGSLSVGGVAVSLVGHTHAGGGVAAGTVITNGTDVGITFHLEFNSIEGTATRPIYLRFHQDNRWYQRIKAEAGVLSYVGGADDTLYSMSAATFYEGGTLLSSKYAAIAHSHTGVSITDTRAAQILPSGYGAYNTYAEFTNQIPGLADWYTAFTMKGWTNGYAVWQIIGPSNTSPQSKFYLRSGLDGTWNPLYEILHTGNAIAANNYLWNNAGGDHGDVVDFNSVLQFGPKYVQAATNGPATSGATQYYSWAIGIGANYPLGGGIGYAAQFAIPRAPVGGLPVLSVRFREAGTWGSWSGVYAQGIQKADGNSITETGNVWRVRTVSGYVDVGPANATWCHFSTDRPSGFYMGNPLHVNGSIYRYGTNYAMDSDGFYLDASASRIRANSSTYTAHEFIGSKNSYAGMRINDAGVTLMYDASGNGGIYREGTAQWHYYWSQANGCLGIDGSGTSSSYSMYVSGGIYATGNVVAYSDERSKENIKTIDGALERVCKMRGVFFTKKGDLARVEQLGVIAQEVQVVLPQAVTYAADVDQYGVHYGNIVGVLIEAIKDQQRQIDELKRQH